MKQDTLKLRLYLGQRKALISYAFSLLGDGWSAEEVVQEAYLRFVPGSKADEHRGPLLGYLYRIVRNLAIDTMRRRTFERRHEAEPAWWAVPAASRTPEEEVAHGMALERMRAVLEAMSPDTRLAVEMHRFGGFSLQDVAQRLNMTVPTTHRLIRDALVQLANAEAAHDRT